MVSTYLTSDSKGILYFHFMVLCCPLLYRLLSASSVMGRHCGFFISAWLYHLHPPSSLSPHPSFILFPVSSILSILLPIYPTSFLRTCTVLSVQFSLQIVPPTLSFSSLLAKTLASISVPHTSPHPVFSSMPPSATHTTLLVSLPPCTHSLSL